MKKHLTLLFTILLLGGSVLGQEVDPIQFLLEVNREVLSARESHRAAEQEVRASGMLPDPTFEATFFPAPVETRNGPMEAQIMLGQRLPLWGKLGYRKQLAVLQMDLAALALRKSEVNTVARLYRASIEHRRIENSLAILRRYQSDLGSSQSVALSQYSTGMAATQHPVLKLQIEATIIENRINVLESQLEVTTINLQTLFDGQFDEHLLVQELPDLAGWEKEKWLDSVRPSNLNLLMAENRMEGARIRRELVKRGNRPDLIAGLNFTSIGEGGMSESTDGTDAFGLKFGLNLPLWRGRNAAREEAAAATVKAAEEASAQAKNDADESLSVTLSELNAVEKTTELFEESLLREAEQMLSSAISAYEAGKIGFLDLLDSQRMAVNIRLDYEETRAKREKTKAKLLKFAGMTQFDEE